MKVLFIGDCHIKINQFDLGMRFLRWLDQLIQDESPDLVVNLGDFFDNHSVVRSEIMTEFMNHCRRVLSAGIPYVYLIANHDLHRIGSYAYYSVKHLKGQIDNLYIVDEPTDMFDITFVPYVHDPNNFPKKTRAICAAHQTFLGADYGSMVSDTGVVPDDISAELIVSGHIHKKSILGKVQYVGSPFSQSASDVDQVKGISILETDTASWSFRECPLPRWRKISLSASDITLSSVLGALISCNKDDHWILELTGCKAEIAHILESQQYKDAVKGLDLKIKTVFTDTEKRKISITAKSIEYIIAEYVNKVYDGNIDKDKLIKASMDALTSVRGNLV